MRLSLRTETEVVGLDDMTLLKNGLYWLLPKMEFYLKVELFIFYIYTNEPSLLNENKRQLRGQSLKSQVGKFVFANSLVMV